MAWLLIRQDWANHSFYGTLIYIICWSVNIHFLHINQLFCLSIVFVVAICKELYDWQIKETKEFSLWDIIWTVGIPILLYGIQFLK